MKIALFGSTGRIGQIVLRRALEQGYEVNAYARRTVSFTHDSQVVPKAVKTIWLQGNMKANHVQGGKCLLCTWFSF